MLHVLYKYFNYMFVRSELGDDNDDRSKNIWKSMFATENVYMLTRFLLNVTKSGIMFKDFRIDLVKPMYLTSNKLSSTPTITTCYPQPIMLSLESKEAFRQCSGLNETWRSFLSYHGKYICQAEYTRNRCKILTNLPSICNKIDVLHADG